ncbi:lipid droplet assembly factor 1 isoform X2 [Ascaphus truei]|uniref:lipid droplet assembly factor 1 isoform X2 n=1 Tax=Ascaphus truei TaxID=8439 RepID=UPI003F5A7FE3
MVPDCRIATCQARCHGDYPERVNERHVDIQYAHPLALCYGEKVQQFRTCKFDCLKKIKMTNPEGLYHEKIQDFQKQLNSVMETINSNSKVVAFMNSPFGQYLDEHPFVSLSLLVFAALSAVPVGLFMVLIVGTAITACLGVIIIEGVVISVGGIALVCVLCGLAVLAFGVSGVLSFCYVAVSSILNYMHTSRANPHLHVHSRSIAPMYHFGTQGIA